MYKEHNYAITHVKLFSVSVNIALQNARAHNRNEALILSKFGFHSNECNEKRQETNINITQQHDLD